MNTLLATLLLIGSAFAAPSKLICDDSEKIDQALKDLTRTEDILPMECPQSNPNPSGLAPLGSRPKGKVLLNREFKSIDMPIDGEITKVTYASFPARGTSKGTVVVLGGGPATPWIHKGRPLSVPPMYDVIVIDYPGSGANAKLPFAAKDQSSIFTLSTAAESVKEIIRQNRIKNYVIYGHSYGTAVATAAVNKIEDDPKIEKPKGLMLEGTLGRSFKDGKSAKEAHEHDLGYVKTSNEALKLLTTEEQDRFRKKVRALTQGQPSHQLALGKYLLHQLPQGARGTAELMRILINMPNDTVLACAKAFMKAEAESEILDPLNSENSKKNFMRAACEIVSPSQGSTNYKLFEGLLEENSATLELCRCADPKQSGTYDASKMKIKNTPLLYIQGESDPNTPPWQMDYHRQQMQSPSAIYRIPGGGHSEFFSASMEKRCYLNGFEAAFQGKTDGWNEAMKDCRTTMSYSNPPPGPLPLAPPGTAQ